jgi:hypothetical protein
MAGLAPAIMMPFFTMGALLGARHKAGHDVIKG